MNKPLIIIAAPLIVALTFAAGYLANDRDPNEHAMAHDTTADDTPEDGAKAEREVLYWYDPMVPGQRFDEPGPSPFMDMELVPRYAEDAAGGAIRVDAELRASLGMRSAPVTRGTFWQRVDTSTTVMTNADTLAAVQPRVAGWLATVPVTTAGIAVSKGDVLATVFAPELAGAADELRLARSRGDTALIRASRRRLESFGLDADSINALADGTLDPARIPLRAPIDGHVHRVSAVAGQRVAPGDTLFTIADAQRMWVMAALPESRAQWVDRGRPARLRFASLPGETFEAPVDLVAPTLDSATGTLSLRLQLNNPDHRLRPGMRGQATLWGGPRRGVLLVPSAAIIRDGRDTRVVRDDGEDGLTVVAIVAGDDDGEHTVIREGLSEGDQVLVSGQFLLDSEARLRNLQPRLTANGAVEPAKHDAHDSNMRDQPEHAPPDADEGTRTNDTAGTPPAHHGH